MDGASQTVDEDACNNLPAEAVTESHSVAPVSRAGVADGGGGGAANLDSHGAGPEPNYPPGVRLFSGRSVQAEDVKEVIRLLAEAGIPACVVGVYALRYFGAGRRSNEWDICIPDEMLDVARAIFENDSRFEQASHTPPLIQSLRHTRPTFMLKGVSFFFILVTTSDHFINPHPDSCELSRHGIPYPKLHYFARSLLVLQNGSDLCDFIDGMDLDEEWGEANLDYENLQIQGLKFTKALNAVLDEKDLGCLQLNHNYRSVWNQLVNDKEKRIEPMKKGRYKTQWRRIKNDMDPRLRDRRI